MIVRLSLRARLLVAVSGVALTVLVVADFAVYAAVRSYLYQQADALLQTSHFAVEQAATGHPPGQGAPGPPGGGGVPNGTSAFCGLGRESAPGMFIEVRGADGRALGGEECPAYEPGSKPVVPRLPSSIGGDADSAEDLGGQTTYFTTAATSGATTFRVRASKLANGDTLILADPIGGIGSTLGRLLGIELGVIAAALLAAAGLGFVVVRVGLRPLRDVERTAVEISAGDLTHRVANPSPRTEVGHVASALNGMLERIEADFGELQASEQRLRRFVGDASHELRTPIAAVSAYAQLFHQGAAEHQEDLARAMAGIERESGRMANLVEGLLTLARFDEGRPIAPQRVDLVELATEALETARTVGPEWPASLEVDDVVEVDGDPGALREVLDNLLANVRAHTPPGTPAAVRVSRSESRAVLEVSDRGPGFGEDEASHLFERFFRVDASRTRATGGSGLGLAIAASIVRAHGGQVAAAPRVGGGAVFTVRLPALGEDALEG